ncbi:MAG: energy transducer TonB [Gemmatimonadaceae bacterium]|nr:energy transducer TonB [Gemmatimonadaceae bacterium]
MDLRHAALHVRILVALTSVCGASHAIDAQRATEGGAVRLQVRSVSGVPVVGAQMRVAPADPLLESDERGLFAVTRVPVEGAWLRVRRIGYRPDSVRVAAALGKTLDTVLTMERIAVDLAPVTVVGRRDVQGPMAGFYHRRSTGSGRFFTHAEIERRAPHNMTDLLRDIPGMRINSRLQTNTVRMRGSRCSPLVWLDGQGLFATDIDLDALDPQSFDGVEVYGTASVPVEFQGNQRASSSCGTILLWTRRGEPRKANTPKRKNGEVSPAAQIARLLDELRVYTAADVDSAARIDSLVLVHPEYPDSLYEAQAPGRLLAEFIVGVNGNVIIETFSAVTTTHRDLVDPVREALRSQRFKPAMRQGRPVQQVMQLPFDFVPDSTVRRQKR